MMKDVLIKIVEEAGATVREALRTPRGVLRLGSLLLYAAVAGAIFLIVYDIVRHRLGY